jgi:hypothetical protein
MDDEMIKRAMLAVVLAATAFITPFGVADAHSPALDTTPTTVVIHDIPKAYWDAVNRCTRDDSVAERSRCIGVTPWNPDVWCLRVQLMYYPGDRVETTRNDCGY